MIIQRIENHENFDRRSGKTTHLIDWVLNPAGSPRFLIVVNLAMTRYIEMTQPAMKGKILTINQLKHGALRGMYPTPEIAIDEADAMFYEIFGPCYIAAMSFSTFDSISVDA